MYKYGMLWIAHWQLLLQQHYVNANAQKAGYIEVENPSSQKKNVLFYIYKHEKQDTARHKAEQSLPVSLY